MRALLLAALFAAPAFAEEAPPPAAEAVPAAPALEVPAAPVAAPAVPVLAPLPEAPSSSVEKQPIGKPPAGQGDPGVAGAAAPSAGGAWRTAAACLTVGLLLGGGVLVLRRLFPTKRPGGANALLEVLARTPLGPKHTAVLLRVGGKVLVVGVGPETMTALAQVDEPAEVERLLLKEAGRPAEKGFGGMLAGAISSFRSEPMGSLQGKGPEADDLEGEIKALGRRVASWRVDEGERPRG